MRVRRLLILKKCNLDDVSFKYLEKNKLNKKFRMKIKKFCDDEDNHKKYAESHLIDSDFKVNLFKEFTRNLTKVAIKISKKI